MKLTRLIGLVGGAVLAVASVAGAQVTYRTLVFSRTDGPLGPNLGEGVQFSSFTINQPARFDTPAIDHLGNVVFTAQVVGTGISSSNNSGVWLVSPDGSRSPVFREGEPLAGYPGLLFGNFWWTSQSNPDGYIPAVVSNGRVAVRTIFTGDGVDESNDHGVMLWDKNARSMVMREGDPTPGIPSSVFRAPKPASAGVSPDPLRLSETGIVQLYCESSALVHGVWRGNSSDPPSLVLANGMELPGFSPVTISQVYQKHEISSDGTAYLSVRYLDEGGVSKTALCKDDGAGTAVMLKSGDTAITFEGETFDRISVWGANGAGEVLIYATTELDGDNEQGHEGSWRVSDRGLYPVVQFPGGSILHGVAEINANGQVVFQDFVNTNVYLINEDELQLIASEAGIQNAFGLPMSLITYPVINGRGQIAFNGSLGTFLDEALFATTRSGELSLIAAKGQMYEITPGDMREIRSVIHATDSGGADGQRVSFNDRGELVFKLVFSDNSGAIVVATIDPVICPGDVTNDFTIDVDDLNVVLSSWSMSVTPGTAGDVDGTGFVDVDDLNLVLGAWGTVCN